MGRHTTYFFLLDAFDTSCNAVLLKYTSVVQQNQITVQPKIHVNNSTSVNYSFTQRIVPLGPLASHKVIV